MIMESKRLKPRSERQQESGLSTKKKKQIRASKSKNDLQSGRKKNTTATSCKSIKTKSVKKMRKKRSKTDAAAPLSGDQSNHSSIQSSSRRQHAVGSHQAAPMGSRLSNISNGSAPPPASAGAMAVVLDGSAYDPFKAQPSRGSAETSSRHKRNTAKNSHVKQRKQTFGDHVTSMRLVVSAVPQKEVMNKMVVKVKERKQKEPKKPTVTEADPKSLILLDMPRTNRSLRLSVTKTDDAMEQKTRDPKREKQANEKIKALTASTEERVADEDGFMLQIVRNNENNGILFLEPFFDPFWSNPMEPSDEDLARDGIDEGPRIDSELLTEVLTGRVGLTAMPSTPILLDPTAPTTELCARDNLFLEDIVFSNTIRSVVNTNDELPQITKEVKRRQDDENAPPSLEACALFDIPEKAYVYSRNDPIGSSRLRQSVNLAPKNA
ncbi:unnamed protein product [Caenorhabditis auriculariae]|uniref:Uncharacterized protein n=1 Tax=Caenorhabditis auriculariae TaxID=2777116 RepID=A0A8S1HYZ8_9PELO|nr:unnamed protein product [Caenorhabditis auriculariae]